MGDVVTLITRPRRFGKTLTMSMVEKFFSVDYAERGDLFEGLSVWQDEIHQMNMQQLLALRKRKYFPPWMNCSFHALYGGYFRKDR